MSVALEEKDMNEVTEGGEKKLSKKELNKLAKAAKIAELKAQVRCVGNSCYSYNFIPPFYNNPSSLPASRPWSVANGRRRRGRRFGGDVWQLRHDPVGRQEGLGLHTPEPNRCRSPWTRGERDALHQ